MQAFPEQLEANFKNLDRMELTSNLTLQFLSSLNNECVRATESTDKIWMLSFPGEKQMSNLKRPLL